MNLESTKYDFKQTPFSYPPQEPGWFLFQVVSVPRGGGTVMGGYSGNELHNSAISGELVCIWARKK